MVQKPRHTEAKGDQNRMWPLLKNILLIILGLAGGILLGRQFTIKSPEPWKPVLETSNFEYLSDEVNTALTKMKEAAGPDNHQLALKESPFVQQIEQSLFKLKYYYLPITEVRQLIYDADRLYYLNEKEQAHGKLENARKLLELAAQSDVISLQKPLSELIAKIDDLMISVSKNSPDIPVKFSNVGHRVNMMAYKGELIISGVKIPEEK